MKSKKHIGKTNMMELFRCNFCNYATKRKNNYIRHVNTIHNRLENINISTSNGGCDNFESSLNKILEEQENIKKMIPNSGGNTIINNKLSINVFLNTQCKQAMSIDDFVNQLQISLEDLKYSKNKGYVKGISNVFVKQLADLEPKERPIHCSDKKRLQFYIKNTNSWEKDDDNKNINKAIGNVQKKQIELLFLWDKEHPGWENNERLIMERLAIAKSIYGSTTDKERTKENKQIKKIIGEKIELDDIVLNFKET
tara:strand:+ start:5604 stop:6365 length:762 start_codon:yes stop_codon:yes gene_type:complete